MTFSPRTIAATVLLSAFCAAPALTAPATQPVEEAIAHLGDPDPAVREQAVRTLQAAGADARAALEAAANGDDPEIAARAKAALRMVSASPAEKPAEDDETGPQILNYRASNPDSKREIINRLSSTGDGLRVLTKIWVIETDPELRSVIFDQLLSEVSTTASSLLADGNVSTAELLLQAAVDRKTADAPPAYAAYWLGRGRLDDAIRRWSARGGQKPADIWAETVLAALYRAKGDAKAAIAHAEASEDSDVLQETLLWAGEWSRLAVELRRDAAAPQEPRAIALRCGADALGGDQKAVDADVAHLTNLVHDAEQAGAAGDILLLIDRPREAVKLLEDNRQFYAAYEILDDRGMFDDAAALLAAHDKETTEEAMMLRASAAKEFARLGLKDQFTAMAGRVSKGNAANKFPRVFLSLGEAEREAGLIDKSWEHFQAAIEAAGDNNPQWYVTRAFPPKGNDIEWSGIWSAAMSANPQRPVKELFERVRKAYDGSMPLDELVTAVEHVDLSSEFSRELNHPYVELIWETSQRLIAAGRKADADKLVEERAQSASNGDLYLYLGDAAAHQKDWAAAIKRYEQAWKKDRTRALPLYLQGWAMEQAGQRVEGRERMALAHKLPVGDETRRAEFIRGLIYRNLDDAAAREADVLIRTGSPLSGSSQEALRAAAALADDRRDYAIATALWQRAIADYLSGSYWFETHAQCLHMPNVIRESHARALIMAGDIDGAQREIKTSLELLPIDSSIVIDAVPELDKAGKHAEADALFAKMFATQEALVEKYPQSAFQLNECAWLAAKCHRELDKAVLYAQRGVDLQPKSVDVIDTLAEAYFQHGDIEKALAEEKKCVELAPNIPFHRKQMERFEAAVKK
jgi:tetratricopeptide (TPR) repeat protein